MSAALRGVVVLAWVLWALPAVAADGVDAEYRRLVEAAQGYAERNAWGAVARAFDELEQLKDAPLTMGDLFLGAQAARATGDALTCRDRLLAAFEKNLGPGEAFNPLAAQWLGELQTNYGRVVIKLKGDAPLAPDQVPFQTDRKAAIDFAVATLARDGTFDGLLPVGRYTVGPHPLEVTAGTEVVKHKFKVK